MSSIRKNWLSEIVAFIALMAMTFAALISSADPGGLKAEVSSVGDGTAKIIFKPNGSADHVTVNNRHGEPIGKLNWAASFEMSVTEDALRKATTKEGIDLNALLQGIGTIQSGSKTLVAAELPVAIQDLDGRELAAGTKVYFGLDRLAKKGVMAPVVAWGGKSEGPGGAANEFNDRLYRSGVKGQNSRPKARPVAHPSAAVNKNVHGDGYFPMEAKTAADEMALLGRRFLSSPTCTVSEARTIRTSSYYGYRRQVRATNGEWISKLHDGEDIAAPIGTPVMAPAGGCVSVKQMTLNPATGRFGVGYGLSLVIDHGNGFSTQYGHMNNFSPKIQDLIARNRAGEKYCFARGEQIGNTGVTGRCTGPHLHFGMSHNGKSVNPRDYMLARTDSDLSQTCSVLQASNEALKQKLGEGATAVAAGTGNPLAVEDSSVSVAQSRSTTVAQ